MRGTRVIIALCAAAVPLAGTRWAGSAASFPSQFELDELAQQLRSAKTARDNEIASMLSAAKQEMKLAHQQQVHEPTAQRPRINVMCGSFWFRLIQSVWTMSGIESNKSSELWILASISRLTAFCVVLNDCIVFSPAACFHIGAGTVGPRRA